MEKERPPILPDDKSIIGGILKVSTSIDQVQTDLLLTGARPTFYGFNLVQSVPKDTPKKALDIISPNGLRYYIYPNSDTDTSIRQKYTKNDIQQFDSVPITDSSFSVLSLPIGTLPLQGVALREQYYTGESYIGAYELMQKLGQLLGRIKRFTHALPSNLTLSQIAVANGEDYFIRLIPPYSLDNEESISNIKKTLYNELTQVDSVHNHSGQVQALDQSHLGKEYGCQIYYLDEQTDPQSQRLEKEK